MELENINVEVCRVCLTPDEVSSLYENVETDKEIHFADIINKYCKVEVSPDDTKPQMICEKCADTSRALLEFKKQCKESDCKLSIEYSKKSNLDELPLSTVKKLIRRCRICISKEEIVFPLYKKLETDIDLNYADIIFKFSKIPVSLLDYKPQLICLECAEMSMALAEFCKKCKESDEILTSERVHFTNSRIKENVGNINVPTLKKKPVEEQNGATAFISVQNDLTILLNNPNLNNEKIKEIQTIKLEEAKEIDYLKNPLVPTMPMKVPESLKKRLSLLSEGLKKLQEENNDKNDENNKKIDPFTPTFICNICGLLIDTRIELIAHKKGHTKENCEFCEYKWSDRVKYDDHLLKKHPGKGHKCPVCEKIFKVLKNFNLHLRTHKDKIKIKCKICKKSFCDNYYKKVHKYAHSGEKNHSCEECGRKFESKRSLRSHMFLHSNQRAYTCEKCDIGFGKRPLLKKHYKIKHNFGDRKIKNLLQKATFRRELITKQLGEIVPEGYQVDETQNLPIPKDEIKSEPEKYICDVCGFLTESLEDLSNHKSRHPTKKCLYCTYIWKNGKDLNSHIYQCHPEKGYKCRDCKKIFTLQKTYSNHMWRHKNKEKIRPKCEICEKTFSSRGGLNSHRIVHQEERPHICIQCGNTFKKRHGLQNHRNNIHVNKTSCEICKIIFQTEKILQDHFLKNHSPSKVTLKPERSVIKNLKAEDNTIEVTETTISSILTESDHFNEKNLENTYVNDTENSFHIKIEDDIDTPEFASINFRNQKCKDVSTDVKIKEGLIELNSNLHKRQEESNLKIENFRCKEDVSDNIIKMEEVSDFKSESTNSVFLTVL